MNKKSILSDYNSLNDLKLLSLENLIFFSEEIRSNIIENIVKNGGHLGSNLGVVELTVALHYVFNATNDKIIFDIGHQSLTHKILTGRKDFISKINAKGGISTYCSIDENDEFDVFGAGHSSTSISAGLGIYHGLRQDGRNSYVIPIIGDASIASGMAWEALNNLDGVDSRFIIILNDNDMSISKPCGMLYKHFLMLKTKKFYKKPRFFIEKLLSNSPKFIKKIVHFIADFLNNSLIKLSNIRNVFSHFGLNYVGIVDGHNIEEMITIFERIKIESKRNKKPILLHIKTEKGKGMPFSSQERFCYHSVNKKTDIKKISYPDLAGKTIFQMQKLYSDVNVITPAMQSGSCLTECFELHKERSFDVGISEQHALTFAAGLARIGKKPYCFIYSTFLQRAYDQAIHDIIIQNLPVRIIIDRAGIVQKEGKTHQGLLDISMFMNFDIIMCSPSNGIELIEMFKFSLKLNKPFLMRYSKTILPDYESFENFSIQNELKKENHDKSVLKIKKIINLDYAQSCIIAYGDVVSSCIDISNSLLENDIKCDVYDLRFIKPLDTESLNQIAIKYKHIFIMEDAYEFGGIGSFLFEYFKKIDKNINIKIFGFPIHKLPNNLSLNEILIENRLSVEDICLRIKDFLNS